MKTLLGTLGVVVSLLSVKAAAHEGASVSPELTQDSVKVLRVRIPPHGTLPMHTIPPHVTVWLTDADMEIAFPDGRREVHHARAGDVTWVAVGKHSGRNLGAKPVEFIAVEPVGAAAAAGER
jgi:quercetin dioxygenase-like cupin family protein